MAKFVLVPSGTEVRSRSSRKAGVDQTPGGTTETGVMKADFRVVYLVTAVGERFPVLIDADTGLPARMALRYAFEERSRGGAARIEERMRRIAELYQWSREAGNDLDSMLMRGERLPIQHVLRALQDWGARASDSVRKKSSRAPAESGSPSMTNQRIRAWEEFLIFSSIPDRWRSGAIRETPNEILLRRIYADELKIAVGSRKQLLPTVTSHEPLSAHEVGAIDDVLFGNRELSPFLKTTHWRNGLLYRYIRFGGPRIGEALCLKVEDLPVELGAGSMTMSRLTGIPQFVQVVRRPDDPEDTRVREARVKRGDRSIELPDDLISGLRAYAKKRSASPDVSPYLFISSVDHTRPLSQTRAEKIIAQIGKAAGVRFEQLYPGMRHTLNKLCWHRLRTTRAIELVPEFFPNGIETETAKMEFIQFFGWSSINSAKPYLQKLRERQAHALKRSIQAEIRFSK